MGGVRSRKLSKKSATVVSVDCMKATSKLLVAGALLLAATSGSSAGTTVTGIVVDGIGKPIEGVACLLAGTPTASNRIIYSGIAVPVFTDKEGRFSISLPQGSLADLQFDGGDFAPVFLYRVNPDDSPLRVVMTEGKSLRGRVVDEQHAPIAHAEIELQMGQEDRWYQRKGITDSNGEFQFRICEPPQKSPWLLYFAGKRFEIDYSKVATGAFYTLQADVRITADPHPGGAANESPPVRSGATGTPETGGSRR